MAFPLRGLFLLVLAPWCCTAAFQKEENVLQRLLQSSTTGRNCNSTLGVVTTAQVKKVGEIFLRPLVENAERSRDILFQTAVYDFKVFKLCSSCRDINIFYAGLGEGYPVDWLNYCDTSILGYDTLQSFLVFLPLDPETGDVLSGGSLRAFMSLHASRPGSRDAPTEAWPANLTHTLEEVRSGRLASATFRESSFGQKVPSMLAAASGSVAIMPDFHGHGESQQNMTYMWPTGYKQSVIVSFLHVREFLHKYTNCTRLDLEHVTVQGFEDGARGGMEAAQGFRWFKTKVLRVFSGSGVLDLETLILHALRSVTESRGLRQRTLDMLEMAAFSFSWGNPHLVNTGTGQELVAAEYREEVFAKYSKVKAAPSVSVAQGGAISDAEEGDVVVGKDELNLDFLNPDLLDYFKSTLDLNLTSPCATVNETVYAPKIGFLCQAIKNTSSYPILRNELKQNWIHDLEFCFGEEDPVVGREQVENVVDDVPLGEIYRGPSGESSTELMPLGDKHSQIVNICGISAGLFYVLQGHQPENVEDRPAFLGDLPEELGRQCGTVEIPVDDTAPTGSDSGQGGGGGGAVIDDPPAEANTDNDSAGTNDEVSGNENDTNGAATGAGADSLGSDNDEETENPESPSATSSAAIVHKTPALLVFWGICTVLMILRQ